MNRGFLGPIQGVTRVPNRDGFHVDVRRRIERDEINAYSAAATSEGFGFAADIMKSLMRGTISDLKREPLNTP